PGPDPGRAQRRADRPALRGPGDRTREAAGHARRTDLMQPDRSLRRRARPGPGGGDGRGRGRPAAAAQPPRPARPPGGADRRDPPAPAHEPPSGAHLLKASTARPARSIGWHLAPDGVKSLKNKDKGS